MARIRTVKPEFWVDEKIVELTFPARLLFIGLWNFADDEGRMVCSPNKIKMQIFPSDTLDISGLIGELRREKMIHTYTIDSVEYLQIQNFAKHQKVDKRTLSKLPSPKVSPESPRIPPTDQGRDQGRDQVSSIKEGIKDKRKFNPPSLSDVQNYCLERKNNVNPEDFINHYETNGWIRGKTKIKDWKACVRTWEKNSPRGGNHEAHQRPLSAVERVEKANKLGKYADDYREPIDITPDS